MAAERGDAGGRPAVSAVRVVIDDRARAKARTLRRHRDWDAAGTAEVSLPVPLTELALAGAGYRRAPHGGWVGPDGERYGSLDEAGRTEFTAAAISAAEGHRDPMEEALRQIREVATIPVGQILLGPEERIRALTAKLERIGNIAADGEPDEDWPPALIEEARDAG
ncbi:MAG: hypothetical protein JSU06_00410 [Actinobacteria bacterium]|nr:hypothetical protein [Actinomycetota bacterium]